MKKKISLIFLFMVIVSSTYAVNISTGGSFNLGGMSSLEKQYNGTSYGCSAMFNIDLFYGLGFQSEINVTTSTVSCTNSKITFKEIESILDVPVMLWWNGKFGFIGCGAGAGINFSLLDTVDSRMNMGWCFGSNVIFYIGNHIGIMLGIHGVFDFPTQFYYEVDYEENTSSIGVVDSGFLRSTVYGKLGVVYRF